LLDISHHQMSFSEIPIAIGLIVKVVAAQWKRPRQAGDPFFYFRFIKCISQTEKVLLGLRKMAESDVIQRGVMIVICLQV